MRLLIDTHILLWTLAQREKLPEAGFTLMADPGNFVQASAVAIWEIAIKHARNRGRADDMPITGRQALLLSETAGIDLIDITPEHTAAVDDLLLHHRDPFDRLMISQARCEDMVFLTSDKELAAYGDFVMVV